MREPDADFQPLQILRTLGAYRVAYVLIGALAATFHGSPVRTNDADICPQRVQDNLERLARALREMEARIRVLQEPAGVPFRCDAQALEGAEIWTLITRFGPLDLSYVPSGTRGYDDLKRESVVYEIDDVRVPTASLLDVIRSKEAAGRTKDHSVLPMLRAMLERQSEA